MLNNKNIINFVLSIILGIFVLLFVVNTVFRQNIFNVSWYKKAVSSSIKKEIKDKIEEKLKLITLESSFPEELYKDIIKDEMIDINIDSILQENVKALRGQEYNKDVINVDSMLVAYYQRIDEYIQIMHDTMKVEINDDAIRAIDNIKLRAKNETINVISNLNFWVFLENNNNSRVLRLISGMSFLAGTNITILCIIAIVVIILGMLFINASEISIFFKFFGTALFLAGIFPFSFGLSGNLSKIANNILFASNYTNKLLGLLMNSVFEFLIMFGIVLILIGSIGIFVSSVTSIRRTRLVSSKVNHDHMNR